LANFDAISAMGALLLIAAAALRLQRNFTGLRREISNLNTNTANLRQIVEGLQRSNARLASRVPITRPCEQRRLDRG
jgi:cell division protein FtsL